MITTLTSREFNQDTSGAKRAAESGPVYITDRGRPAHVLLSMDAYQRLLRNEQSIGEALSMTVESYVDFEPPRMSLELRLPDFMSRSAALNATCSSPQQPWSMISLS